MPQREYQSGLVNIIGMNQMGGASSPLQPSQLQIPARPQPQPTAIPEQYQIPDETSEQYQKVAEETQYQYEVVRKALETQSQIRAAATLSRGSPERHSGLASIFDAISNAGLGYLEMQHRQAEEKAERLSEQEAAAAEAAKIEAENRKSLGLIALNDILTNAQAQMRQYGRENGLYTTRSDVYRVLEAYRDLPPPLLEELYRFAGTELRELEGETSSAYYDAVEELNTSQASAVEANIHFGLSGIYARLENPSAAPQDTANLISQADHYILQSTRSLSPEMRLRVTANVINRLAQSSSLSEGQRVQFQQRQADLLNFIPMIAQIRQHYGSNEAAFREQLYLHAPQSIQSLVADIPNSSQLLSDLRGQIGDQAAIQDIFRQEQLRQQRAQGINPAAVSTGTEIAYQIFNRTSPNALAEYNRIRSLPEAERLPHESLVLTILDSWNQDKEEYNRLNNQLQELFQDQAGEVIRFAEGDAPQTATYIDPNDPDTAWRLLVRDPESETVVYARDGISPAQQDAMRARIESVNNQIVQTRAQIQDVLRRASSSGLNLTDPLDRSYLDMINFEATGAGLPQPGAGYGAYNTGHEYGPPLPTQGQLQGGSNASPAPSIPGLGQGLGLTPQTATQGLQGRLNTSNLVNSPAQSGLPQFPISNYSSPQSFLQNNRGWNSTGSAPYSGFNWGISQPPPLTPSGIPPMYPFARTQVNGLDIPLPFPTETTRSVLSSNQLRVTRAPAAGANYREGRNSPLTRVVLHETVGTADSAISWMQNPQSQVSYHYIVRRNGDIVNLVHPGDTAFGAYGANDGSLHISLETPDDGRGNEPTHSGYTPEQYRALNQLLDSQNLRQYEITTHETVDTTGERVDPRSFNQQLFQQARDASQGRVATTIPLNVTTSSGYGMREHPVRGGQAFHAGLDLSAPEFYGGDVGAISMTGGHVVHVREWNGYGGTVIVQTPEGYYEQYSHLRSFLVQEGQQITPGQPIGVIGGDRSDPMAGTSTGRHLHFQVWGPNTNPLTGDPHSDTIDPTTYLSQLGVTEYPGRGIGQTYDFPSGSISGLPSPDAMPMNNGNWLGTLNADTYPYLTSFFQSIGIPNLMVPSEQVYQNTNPVPSTLSPSSSNSYGQTSPTDNYGYDIIAQDRDFAAAIADVSNQLGIPGQWLADLMAHESAYTFDTGIQGIDTEWGRGVGLIQAMTGGVLRDWGYTYEQVAAMSRAEYMYKIVLRYLQPVADRLHSIRDLATAVYRGLGSLDWSDSQELLDYIDRLGETVGRRYRSNNLQSSLQHTHDSYQENCPICQQQLNRYGAIVPHQVG